MPRSPSRLLSEGRNRTKAEVRLHQIEGLDVVVKDFRGRSLLVRSTIGRFSISRETRAYERLRALPGIPAFYGRVDAHALAYAFVPGSSLPQHRKRSLPPAFFEALGELLEEIHERGVAIVDLHHRNVLVSLATGRPALIDFSLALVRPRFRNPISEWLFERAIRLDRIALDRIRTRYEAGASDPSSDEALPRAYRWGRSLKRWMRARRRRV